MKKNTFNLSQELLSFSRYVTFYPDIFGYVGKRLDKIAKVNLKNYDVTDWETNDYNTYTAQRLKK